MWVVVKFKKLIPGSNEYEIYFTDLYTFMILLKSNNLN